MKKRSEHPDSLHASQSPVPQRRKAVRRREGPQCLPKGGDDLQSSPPKHLWEFATLAHELKQPLTAILSSAQAARHLLARHTSDLPEVHEVLANIIAEARRGNEVLQRLQKFVTTGELEAARLNINDIVRETIELVHSDATAQGVLLTLALADNLPLIYGDHIQLRQVLLNLVRNAFEAMSQLEDGDRALVVRTSSATRGCITVEVQDCGIVVDETTIERLFHPFFTTKPGGMGLGLALSRSIITAHGGWIWATRNLERGLTLSFTLPAIS